MARAGVELEALRIAAVLRQGNGRGVSEPFGPGARGCALAPTAAPSFASRSVKVAMLLSTLITLPSSQSSSGRGEKPRSNPNTVHPCASDATKQAQRDKGGYGGRIKQTVSGDFEEQVMEVYEPYHA